jgi:peptidoglycan/xylan/chitin deacetylase (PgdA/CDA1 family)
VFRTAVALIVASAALCLPLPGGGSGRLDALGRRWEPPAIAPAPDPEEPVIAAPFRPAYPRFLKSLSGAPEAARRERPVLQPVRELLLTFDDGPDLTSTPLVLDELDRRHLKAIFFVTGHNLVGKTAMVQARRELVRKIASHGHLVANHTLSHANLCRTPEAIPREVDGNAEIIAGATGVRPLLFRSPYGASCHALADALAERDLVQVGWNIDPQDWNAERTGRVFEYVVEKLDELPGKGILLLHDTHPAAVHALPRILDWIEAENRRAARGQTRPIRLVDYTVFLPPRVLPPTGLEAPLEDLARRVTGAWRQLASL